MTQLSTKIQLMPRTASPASVISLYRLIEVGDWYVFFSAHRIIKNVIYGIRLNEDARGYSEKIRITRHETVQRDIF